MSDVSDQMSDVRNQKSSVEDPESVIAGQKTLIEDLRKEVQRFKQMAHGATVRENKAHEQCKFMERRLVEEDNPTTFPIQAGTGSYKGSGYPRRIPWSVADLAYSVYASRYGTSQSLARLAERGGFGPCEMDDFLPDWRVRCDDLEIMKAQVTAANLCRQAAITDKEQAEAKLAKCKRIFEVIEHIAVLMQARKFDEMTTYIEGALAGLEVSD